MGRKHIVEVEQPLRQLSLSPTSAVPKHKNKHGKKPTRGREREDAENNDKCPVSWKAKSGFS